MVVDRNQFVRRSQTTGAIRQEKVVQHYPQCNAILSGFRSECDCGGYKNRLVNRPFPERELGMIPKVDWDEGDGPEGE